MHCIWTLFGSSVIVYDGNLKQFLHILNRMEWELQYRRPNLPELCRYISTEEKGVLHELFVHFAIELDNQIQPDAHHCMLCAIESVSYLPIVGTQGYSDKTVLVIQEACFFIYIAFIVKELILS